MHGINFVYDIAFELEDDLKELSSSLGTQTTAPLIHKIVNVLEELEQHSQHYEFKDKQLYELKETIKSLECNKINKEQERIGHQKELEKMEEAWHVESMELMKSMDVLEVENDNLRSLIQQASRKSRLCGRKKIGEAMEIKGVHLRLKETIDSQVEQLKSLKKDLAQKCIDIDAMQQQCLNLSNTNAEICEKYCYSRKRTKRLMEEKTNLEARLLINSRSISCGNNSDDVFADQFVVAGGTCGGPPDTNFSWEEMKGYLKDRDRLRSVVTVREEQLSAYKPRTYDDAEVEGPINKEPSDKMSPLSPKEMGIKRFFQRFLSTVKE